MAVVSQTCVWRCGLRGRSYADGRAMRSCVRPRAVEVMPRPVTYSVKIRSTTGAVTGPPSVTTSTSRMVAGSTVPGLR